MRQVLALAMTLALSGCASWFTAYSHGLNPQGELSDCPSPPRCRNSQADDPRHQIAPLKIQGDVLTAWQAAAQALVTWPRTELVDQAPGYLRGEVTSPWCVYTDDFELLLQAEQGLIDVRSSGRIGYYDFNVNRDRIEALRSHLIDAGVVAP